MRFQKPQSPVGGLPGRLCRVSDNKHDWHPRMSMPPIQVGTPPNFWELFSRHSRLHTVADLDHFQLACQTRIAASSFRPRKEKQDVLFKSNTRQPPSNMRMHGVALVLRQLLCPW